MGEGVRMLYGPRMGMIFSRGDICTKIYFIESGELQYSQQHPLTEYVSVSFNEGDVEASVLMGPMQSIATSVSDLYKPSQRSTVQDANATSKMPGKVVTSRWLSE